MKRTDAYRAFKKCLYSGDLKPGQFVSQRELAALLGIPLNPVREAIRQLESEHLINVYPQRGIQIVDADPRTINDAHDYRSLIEQSAIAHFAKAAPDELIERMLKETLEMLRELKSDNADEHRIERVIEAAWNFHEEIVDLQENQIISEHYRLNSARIRLFRSNAYKSKIGDQLIPALEHHVQILKACKRRDVDSARDLIAEDIEVSRRVTLGL